MMTEVPFAANPSESRGELRVSVFLVWRRKPVRTFVSIAGDRSNSWNPEVKRIHGESSTFHERYEEGAEAAIDVETESMLERKFRESSDIWTRKRGSA